MTDDGQVLGFLEASYLLGEDFDSDPQNAWAADILRDQDLSGDQRIAMLVALARTALDESVEAADAEYH